MDWSKFDDMPLKDSVRVTGKQPPLNETATAAMVRRQISYEGPDFKIKEEEINSDQVDGRLVDHGDKQKDPIAGKPTPSPDIETRPDKPEQGSSVDGEEFHKEDKDRENEDESKEKLLDENEEAYRKLIVKKGKPKVRKWPPQFYKKDLVFAFFAFFTFSVDYVTDVMLMVNYYFEGKIELFIITFVFIAVPSIISGIISAIWHRAAYIENMKQFELGKDDDAKSEEWKKKHRMKSRFWYISMTMLSFIQLGRLSRQAEYMLLVGNSLYKQRKISQTENKEERAELARKDRNLRARAINEKRDTAILGLIDGFLESALQVMLQLFLTMRWPLSLTFLRVASLCASLVSTSLIHSTYYRTNRRADKTKAEVSYFSSSFYFLMRFSELGPRYILLAMFLVVFFPWSLIGIPVHILIVYVLYKIHNPSLEGICPEEFGPCFLASLQHLFVLMMSYLGLFSFVNLFEGKTRRPAFIFYLVHYTENVLITAVLLWYLVTNDVYPGWVYALWVMPIGLICHTVLAVLFYQVFHPNKWNVNWKVNWKELKLCEFCKSESDNMPAEQ